jgi:hypothetical protein
MLDGQTGTTENRTVEGGRQPPLQRPV